MNGAAIFFFFGLPALIAVAGWGVVLLNDWNDRRKPHFPAE